MIYLASSLDFFSLLSFSLSVQLLYVSFLLELSQQFVFKNLIGNYCSMHWNLLSLWWMSWLIFLLVFLVNIWFFSTLSKLSVSLGTKVRQYLNPGVAFCWSKFKYLLDSLVYCMMVMCCMIVLYFPELELYISCCYWEFPNTTLLKQFFTRYFFLVVTECPQQMK